VKKGHAYLDPGRWFFHTGQWVQCAEVGKMGAKDWQLTIGLKVWNKPLLSHERHFKSLDDAKKFVSDYYEEPVIDCDPDEFPRPEDL
jgi:hypothetical protein